jgi:FkbH-like protein
MSKNTEIGIYFNKVQQILKSYKEKGILICLCSKNNPENVDEILESHPDMLIKNKDILIKKVNWEEKYKNILEISKELNMHPDSFVFLDDSDYEINSVKYYLPEVMCIQVPKEITEYPKLILQLNSILETKSFTSDDSKKYQLYKDEISRKISKKSSGSIEEYLNSLNLNLKIEVNNLEYITRISQLTSKTNQFNLNKQILEENDIKKMINDKNHFFFTGQVKDNFGDMGITNLAILEIDEDNNTTIKNMIMSCRVFGRMIEYSFLNEMLDFLKKKKISKVTSFFEKSPKNKQFSNFYIENGFRIEYVKNNLTKFNVNLSDLLIPKDTSHIKVNFNGSRKTQTKDWKNTQINT